MDSKTPVLRTENDLLTYLLSRDAGWLAKYKALLGTDRDHARQSLIRRINASRSVGTSPSDLYEAIDETLGTKSFRGMRSEVAELESRANRTLSNIEHSGVASFPASDEVAKEAKPRVKTPVPEIWWVSLVASDPEKLKETALEEPPPQAEHVHEKTTKHGKHNKNGAPRWRCKCGKTWYEHPADWIDGRRLPRAKRAVPREPTNRHDKWVQRQRDLGNCTICGKPAAPYSNCEECRAKKNDSKPVPPLRAWDYSAVILAAKECSLDGEIAKKLGVTRGDITAAKKNDPQFLAAYGQGKADRFVCVICGGPTSSASQPGAKCRTCYQSKHKRGAMQPLIEKTAPTRITMEIEDAKFETQQSTEEAVEQFMVEAEGRPDDLVPSVKDAVKTTNGRIEVQGKVMQLSNAGRLVVGFDGSFFDLKAEERELLCTIADLLQKQPEARS